VSERRDSAAAPPTSQGADALSPEERGRMTRAAALRPLNLLVLVIGAVVCAVSQAWWLIPLTVATYGVLVFLAARDPIFQRRILQKGEVPLPSPDTAKSADVSPERRARWLPRGETRQKVEAALVVYRKVVAAVEESDEVTRAVLKDSIPRLHAAADRLVDVARGREKAVEAARDLRRDAGASASARSENLRELEYRIGAADAEISDTFEEFLSLRAKVVRVSIDNANPTRANDLNASLDELNTRLEALSEIVSPQADSSPKCADTGR
jgi:hypothetical protein